MKKKTCHSSKSKINQVTLMKDLNKDTLQACSVCQKDSSHRLQANLSGSALQHATIKAKDRASSYIRKQDS